jgi:hypothetical protein
MMDGLNDDALFDLQAQRERELREAYQLGLLHGINAQSMAQVNNKVMEFEDYGWSVEREITDDE